MPKRKFDDFFADAQVAPQPASLFASVIANIPCEGAQLSIAQKQLICVLEYGPRSIGVIPRIQAFFRGILTRKRVHFALLSAEPDAVEYALCGVL